MQAFKPVIPESIHQDDVQVKKKTVPAQSKQPANNNNSEAKIYIIFLANLPEDIEEDISDGIYIIATGRRNAMRKIDAIISGADYECIGFDISKSFVLTEGVPIEHRVSLVRFYKYGQKFYTEFSEDIDKFIVQDSDFESSEESEINASGNGIPHILN